MRIKCNAPTTKRQLRLLVLFLFAHVICFANDVQNQYVTVTVRKARISLNVKNQPLKNVFLLIEQKTGLSVGYNATAINAMEPVSYKADDEMLSTVFQDLLKDYQGTVKQVDESHIFLKLEKRKVVEKVVLPVAAIAATPIVVSGTVTDENNQPVPGVSIHEKNTRKNTTTDAGGKYSIAVNTGDVLVYNFIGYAQQEITVGAENMINVQLKVQNSQLKEIVAIGYQSVRKSDVTGAISSVKASELNLTSPSVGQALVGKVAGVQVSQVSGAPYASTKIRVRGIGSINAGSNPLYVVDGYPMDNDIYINPEDIESIDILKDAASAAIYGSRAAGGVVIITTKRGKEGKGKFEYDIQSGVNQLARKVKLLNADEFAQLMIDGRNNSYQDLVVNRGLQWTDAMFSDDNATRVAKVGNANSVQIDPTFYDFASQQMIKPKYNTDWQDLLYRNAIFSRHNLSFSGGSKEVKYYISGGYQNQDGIILNTGIKKINFRANIDGQINSKLRAGMNVSYTNNQNKETEEGRWDHNPIMAALLMLPTYRAYDDNGRIVKNEVAALSATYGYNSFENPLAIAQEINIRRKGNRSTYNGYAVYQLLPELSVKANLGMTNYAEKYDYYYPTSLSSGVNAPYSTQAKAAANAKAKNTGITDQLGEFTANYSKQFNKHKLDVLGGYTVQKTTGDILEVKAQGFQDDRIQELNAKGADAALFTLTTASKYTYTLVSYLGRINYNYDNRYYLTASFRTDASSRFGPENRWGNFPSVAAGWNISNESFYHDWLGQHSTLKLRASWGLSGNNNIGNYNSIQVMGTPTGVPLGNGTVNTGTFAGGIKDPKIGWESTSQYNGGLDIGLFNGRLNVIANYYLSYSYNLLFNQPISAIAGATTVLTNLRDSKIRNRGIDLQLDARVIDGNDFRLNFAGNISVNRNKVLDMGGANTILTAGAERSYLTHITQAGQPVGMFYGFRVLGVATEANYKTLAPSASSSNPLHPGDLYFYDKNGDHVVNDADKDVIGNPYPKFTYGFNLSATYKDFYFSSSFNGSYGNQVLDGQDYYLYNMEGSGNQYADVAQRFRSVSQPGNGKVYRASRAGTQSNSTRLSTFYLQDASYFRCTNIVLGYNFRFRSLQEKLGVTKATIFASVDNAFTITKYKGYNPEVDFNGNSTNPNLAPGVDYGMYPLVRAYNAGVKLAF
ncbi:TonB-dependent receptor [Chitinophaga filiformis]|uniref:SusC/RagA family TonB-linked outer membrane protein n=1 Tax=Chitinophaga filiformis TaxID=104663 RepID=UPI001F1A383F|nr:TonB-dependent receptor [Chitinophaga filiformis]MCF6407620.1 TonB-dependent receptor [Chitinophaga filiformis]MCF6407675.1 TonB-dependent receptor [Chitinophaga filiformis]